MKRSQLSKLQARKLHTVQQSGIYRDLLAWSSTVRIGSQCIYVLFLKPVTDEQCFIKLCKCPTCIRAQLIFYNQFLYQFCPAHKKLTTIMDRWSTTCKLSRKGSFYVFNFVSHTNEQNLYFGKFSPTTIYTYLFMQSYSICTNDRVIAGYIMTKIAI